MCLKNLLYIPISQGVWFIDMAVFLVVLVCLLEICLFVCLLRNSTFSLQGHWSQPIRTKITGHASENSFHNKNRNYDLDSISPADILWTGYQYWRYMTFRRIHRLPIVKGGLQSKLSMADRRLNVWQISWGCDTISPDNIWNLTAKRCAAIPWSY